MDSIRNIRIDSYIGIVLLLPRLSYFSSVLRATTFALLYSCGVQATTDNVISHAD